MFWTECAMLLWLIFCADIMLALEDVDGDLWFYGRDNHNIHAFVLMLLLGVSRCAGRIGKTIGKHLQSMPAVLVFATRLEHVDSVVLATDDLR